MLFPRIYAHPDLSSYTGTEGGNLTLADAPSRRLTPDCKLHPKLWQRVHQEFCGPKGHTCELMALDSNAMTEQDGSLLPHFTPHPSLQSCGVNFFAQDLSSGAPLPEYPYVFPPLSLMGPVLRFLRSHGRSCTVIALDVYPKKYWWPRIQSCASKSCRLAVKRGARTLLLPSKQGWIPHPGIPLLPFTRIYLWSQSCSLLL